MSPPRPEAAPVLSRRDLLCSLLVALAAGALYCATCLRREFTGTIADAAAYLLLADHFSPYRTLTPDLGEFVLGRFPFPPLYPLVLALSGGGSAAPLASYVCGAVTLGLAIGVYHLWLRSVRLPVAAALALAAVLALLPVTFLTAIDIVSEPLYLVLTLAGFTALAGAPDARCGLIAALAFGLAACTRSAGVAVLLAFALSWPCGTKGCLRWWPPLLAAAPVLVWEIVKHVLGYGGAYPVPAEATRDAAYVLRLLGVNLHALADAAITSFDPARHRHVAPALAALGLAAAAGWFAALRRRECAALYVAIYLALLLVWPHPAHARRFLFVVLPLVLGYACLGAMRLAGTQRALAGGAVIAIMVMLGLPSTHTVLANLVSGDADRRSPEWYRIADPAAATRTTQTNARLFRFLHDAAAKLPTGACVSAALPQYVLLHTRRRAEELPRESAGAGALDAALARCPYVMMMAVADYPPSGRPPMYPFARIEDRMTVLAVEYLHPEAGDGTVLAMLARVTRADEGR